MLHIIRLDAKDIREAITEYLTKRGYTNIKGIRLRDLDFIDVEVTHAPHTENIDLQDNKHHGQ